MRRFLVFFLISLIGVSLGAQTESATSGFSSASIYQYSGTLAGSEQLKIRTYIWGQVIKPGLYIVPDDTDLLTLISSAGGPTKDAKLSKVRIIRQSSQGEQVIWVNLQEYMETGKYELIPTLQPGDTIIISGTFYYALRTAADFLYKIAIPVVAVQTIIKNY